MTSQIPVRNKKELSSDEIFTKLSKLKGMEDTIREHEEILRNFMNERQDILDEFYLWEVDVKGDEIQRPFTDKEKADKFATLLKKEGLEVTIKRECYIPDADEYDIMDIETIKDIKKYVNYNKNN